MATKNLGIVQPIDDNEDWGDDYRNAMILIDDAIRSHNLAEDATSHAGLNFAYKAGIIRAGSVVNIVAGGSVLLTDDDTNYIEILPLTGVISSNIVGFSAGSIPLYEVITAAGVIGAVTDVRSLLGVQDIALDVLTAAGDLLTHDGSDYQALTVGNDGEILIADSGEANGMKWVTKKHGIAFFIDGSVAVTVDALSVIIPMDITITGGKIEVSTAPTGSDLICDIHQVSTGVTIFSTQGNRPTIAATATSGVIVAPDIIDINQGDTLSLQIDQKGATIAGAKLRVTLYCKERV